jgi:hypothetical protein
MKLIPLYDAAAPITCTIAPGEIVGRIEVIERMRANLRQLGHTDHGLVLHFPNRPDIAADVHRFAVDEKRCCEFWGFAVDSTMDEVTLRWDAPPGARELLATIAAYLRGDEPVTAISGLL